MANLQHNPFPNGVDFLPNGTSVDGTFTFKFPFEVSPNVLADGDLTPLQLKLEIQTATRPAGVNEWNLTLPANDTGVQAYFTQALAAGYQEINLAQTGLLGTSLTGLNEGDASGFQVVSIGGGGGITTGSLPTGLVSGTSGFQAVDFGGPVVGATATGIANNSTQYTTNITIDGLLIQVLVIGSTIQTFTALINQLNTDLGGLAIASIVGGDLRITSVSKGPSSTVLITAGTLFTVGTIPAFVAILAATAGITQTYDVRATINGVLSTLVVSGPSALTYFALVDHLNVLTTGPGTWTIVDGNLKLTSDTKGTTSTILIADGITSGAVLPLLANLTPVLVTIVAAIPGGSTTYTMTVTTFGTGGTVVHPVSFLGQVATTISDLVAEMDADIGMATVSFVGGKIRITKSNLGAGEDVLITSNGNLIDALKAQFGVGVTVMPRVLGAAVGGAKAFGDVGFRGQFSHDGARAMWLLTIPSDVADTLPHTGGATTLLPPGPVLFEVEMRASDAVNTYFYGDIDGATGGTAGFQEVDVGPVVTGASATGLVDTVPATAGRQDVTFTVAKTGGDPTGLANDATVFTASIIVDGGAPQPIAITGSTAQTFTTLMAELTADITGATVSIVGGNLRFVSSTTGVTSTIAITDTDLFSSLTDFLAVAAAVGGTNAVVTTYTASIVVNGGAVQPISIAGGAAQTYAGLIAELLADIVGVTVSIVAGDLRITSNLIGVLSSIAITNINLFSSLTGFVMVEAAVPGAAGAVTPRILTYTSV